METLNSQSGGNMTDEKMAAKEMVDKIEKSLIPTDKKIDLILFVFNKKDVALLGNFDVAESDDQREKLIGKFDEELNNIVNLLGELNFNFEVTRRIEDDNEVIGFSLIVARKMDDLIKMKEAESNGDDRTIGLLLGYPKTAVEAYVTKDTLDIRKEIPEEEYSALRKEGMLPFLMFAPSKAHWKEELDWARSNKKIIEENTPGIFKEAVDRSEKYINDFEKEQLEKNNQGV